MVSEIAKGGGDSVSGDGQSDTLSHIEIGRERKFPESRVKNERNRGEQLL